MVATIGSISGFFLDLFFLEDKINFKGRKRGSVSSIVSMEDGWV